MLLVHANIDNEDIGYVSTSNTITTEDNNVMLLSEVLYCIVLIQSVLNFRAESLLVSKPHMAQLNQFSELVLFKLVTLYF